MASLTKMPNGSWRIQYMLGSKRRPLYLPAKLTRREAENFAETLQDVVTSKTHNLRLTDEYLRWAMRLPPRVQAKLVRDQLIPPMAADGKDLHTLADLVRDVLAGMVNMKPNTQRNYRQAFRHLTTRFGESARVDLLTTKDADDFVAVLRKNWADATTSRTIKAYRTLFRAAIRWGWTTVNPFEGIKAGSQVNHDRQFYVPLEDFEKLITATPDRQFRVVLALSRLGALRTPSEVVRLKWTNIHWEEGRIMVRSPKTEGKEGGHARFVPLFPRLAAILSEWMAEAPVGPNLFAQADDKNWRTRLKHLIVKTGVKPWPRLFHNMRASRESELAMEYPLATVCQWMGHSKKMAATHYLMQTDSDASFQAALQTPYGVAQEMAHKVSRSGPKQAVEKVETSKNPQETAVKLVSAGHDLPPTGLEPSQALPEKTTNDTEIGAENGAPNTDPRLRTVVERWSSLPESKRVQILRIAGGGL